MCFFLILGNFRLFIVLLNHSDTVTEIEGIHTYADISNLGVYWIV